MTKFAVDAIVSCCSAVCISTFAGVSPGARFPSSLADLVAFKVSTVPVLPTRCAGCVGAAKNGAGTVGVAPGVNLVAIRAANDDGYFFVEAVVCAFMYAGDIGADVTSNS